MAKNKTLYACQNCGAQWPKWEGQCRECGQWNTLVEEVVIPKATTASAARGWSVRNSETHQQKPVKLNETIIETQESRISTQYQELDRVLGGGLVSGQYVLLGGDPGVGKSTLLLQMCGGLAKNQKSVLYISGEESVKQSALRAQRLGIKSPLVEVGAESQMESILELAKNKKPDVLIVDSIQTVYLSHIASAPGSVSQVRECAAQLMSLAKGEGISVFLIGHVTKDGNIAGPKVLEHMVDTVLSFEGDHHHHFRLLRAIKNRFGATSELGVFNMSSKGLEEVSNPSEFFLEERGENLMGSAIYPAMEGTRPLLCEVQALTIPTPMAMPRRTSIGFDQNRVHLLNAVLDKNLDLDLYKNDIFVNVVGGLKLSEPAADLAVAAALLSTLQFQEIHPKTCFFGEVGLTGEVRAASFSEERVRESEKLGFERFVLPMSNKKHLKDHAAKSKSQFFWISHVKSLNKVFQ